MSKDDDIRNGIEVAKMTGEGRGRGRRRWNGGIKKFGKKRGRTFPSSRRRSYNKTIVFRANGAKSNKGAHCKSEGISQNNISQCPHRRRRSATLRTYRRFRGNDFRRRSEGNLSFMDFRCRQTGASDESNPWHILGARGVSFKEVVVAFYRQDTRHAETFTDLEMREVTVAIAPVTFTSSVFRRALHRRPATGNRHQFSTNRDACCVGDGHTSNLSRVPRKIYFLFFFFQNADDWACTCTFLSMPSMILFTMTEIGKRKM